MSSPQTKQALLQSSWTGLVKEKPQNHSDKIFWGPLPTAFFPTRMGAVIFICLFCTEQTERLVASTAQVVNFVPLQKARLFGTCQRSRTGETDSNFLDSLVKLGHVGIVNIFHSREKMKAGVVFTHFPCVEQSREALLHLPVLGYCFYSPWGSLIFVGSSELQGWKDRSQSSGESP